MRKKKALYTVPVTASLSRIIESDNIRLKLQEIDALNLKHYPSPYTAVHYWGPGVNVSQWLGGKEDCEECPDLADGRQVGGAKCRGAWSGCQGNRATAFLYAIQRPKNNRKTRRGPKILAPMGAIHAPVGTIHPDSAWCSCSDLIPAKILKTNVNVN